MSPITPLSSAVLLRIITAHASIFEPKPWNDPEGVGAKVEKIGRKAQPIQKVTAANSPSTAWAQKLPWRPISWEPPNHSSSRVQRFMGAAADEGQLPST